MKHCNDYCCRKNQVEVMVWENGHDLQILDTEHDDNQMTITKDEGEYILARLQKILRPESLVPPLVTK